MESGKARTVQRKTAVLMWFPTLQQHHGSRWWMAWPSLPSSGVRFWQENCPKPTQIPLLTFSLSRLAVLRGLAGQWGEN